uniref:Ig-like domain-containing protein n=1 Tax=Pyxicephalus adspersus TaxID=30357 RepID=A0AAV2ZKL1_PYXAD|nr:TPA: hypothetical protein GDO54_003280 [Pyxicephalus adspersus]
MTWYYVNCSFILIFTWISYTNSIPGYSIEAPKSVTVQRGLCVHIPCHFTVEKSVTLSERNTEGLWFNGTDKNPPPVAATKGDISEATKGRFFLTGEVWKGDCSLSINDAVPSDSSFYLFRLIYSNKYSFSNIKPEVTVIELTDKPEISLEKTLVAGKEVTLTCTSPGRCNGSTPLITWSGVQGKVVTYTADYPDGNKTYYSNITFTPSRLDNTFPLSCTVNFQKSNTSTSQKMILNVEYTIHNENIPIIVMEGKSEIIKCTVDSNPQSNITWYKGEIALQNTSSRQTLIYNVKNANLSDAGIYRCSATNSLSTTNKSIEVTVHYVPRTPQINCSMPKDCIIEGNKTIYINEGSSLSLRCSAESSPAASLAWLKPGNPNTISLDEELHFSNILHSNDGLYTCQANNTYGRSNASVTIKVIYGPRAVSGKDSTCATEERVIKCTCIIQSFPDVNIQWKIDEKSYAISDKDILISTSRFDEETTSMMDLLLNHNEVHSIQCISSNQHNHFTLSLLSKERKYPPSILDSLRNCLHFLLAEVLILL